MPSTWLDNVDSKFMHGGAAICVAVSACMQAWTPKPLVIPSAFAKTDAWFVPVFQYMVEWRAFAPAVAVLYLILLSYGQKAMLDYKPIKMGRTRAVWNTSLSLFSLYGAVVVIPAIAAKVRAQGLATTLCEGPENGIGIGESGLWLWLFVISKVAELLDTAFLVLAKKPLMMLHVWHHTSVLVWSWYMFLSRAGPSVFFSAMNLTVHALMYAYFALADYVKIPGQLALLLTLAQTTQMAAGLTFIVIALNHAREGHACDFTPSAAGISAFIYFSYFVLFARFAVRAYFTKRRGKKDKTPPPPPGSPSKHVQEVDSGLKAAYAQEDECLLPESYSK